MLDIVYACNHILDNMNIKPAPADALCLLYALR